MKKLKTLGIIGGMSHESTLIYERGIHEGIRTELGGNWSGHFVIEHLPFEPLVQQQNASEWLEIGETLAASAKRLQLIGAEAVIMTSNTMHRQTSQIEAALTVPFLHIIDPTAQALLRDKFNTVALLGTRFTMEQNFVRDRLKLQGVNAVVPDAEECQEINRIIYDELCKGVVTSKGRSHFQRVIGRMKKEEGAQAVILGCTEIGMAVKPKDSSLPVYDTTQLHIARAIDFCLGRG